MFHPFSTAVKIILKLHGVRRNRFSISAISQKCVCDGGQSAFVSKREQRRSYPRLCKIVQPYNLCTQPRSIGYPIFRQLRRKSEIDLGGLPDRKKALLHVHQETYRSFTDPKDSSRKCLFQDYVRD